MSGDSYEIINLEDFNQLCSQNAYEIIRNIIHLLGGEAGVDSSDDILLDQMQRQISDRWSLGKTKFKRLSNAATDQ